MPQASAGRSRATILAETETGGRLVAFRSAGCTTGCGMSARCRCRPTFTSPLADPERYQTVYSRIEGSVASSTAGLHFTPELLLELRERGVTWPL